MACFHLLVALVLLPALILLARSEWEERQLRTSEVEGWAIRSAEHQAEEIGRILEGVRHLLIAVAELPAVRAEDGAACSAAVARLIGHYPHLKSLFVLDGAGRVFCASQPAAVGSVRADRPYFRETFADGGFRVGEYVVGRREGMPSLPLSIGFDGPDGRRAGVVGAGLTLRWLEQQLAMQPLPPGSSVTVLDRNGVVMVGLPHAALVGEPAPPLLASLARAGTAGVVHATAEASPDQIERVIGYVPLPAASGSLLVAVGLPQAWALAGIRRDNLVDAALLLGSAALALLVATWGGQRLAAEPIRALIAAAHRWQAGDLAARVELDRPESELGRLALAFNDMAAALERWREELEARTLELQALYDTAPTGLCVVDRAYRFLRVNRCLADINGLPVEEHLGRAVKDVLPGLWAQLEPVYRHVLDTGDPVHDVETCGETRSQPGELRHWLTQYYPLRDKAGAVVAAGVIVQEITARKRAEAQAYQLAYHDPLTGLPNRLLFQDLLRQACGRAEREAGHFALMLLDLDHFKHVNDTLGHSAGDALLTQVAKRLEGLLRKGDIVGRLGGDEFAILAGPAAEATSHATLAERVVGCLGEPYGLRGGEVRTSVSIGVVVFPDEPADAESLLANADMALYAAKEAGRNSWRFFDPLLQERAHYRSQLERDLHRALEHGEFALHYQPILAVQDLQVVELEALLRWQHPRRGLIAPSEFLPFAERSRLILPLTFWVVARAIEQVAQWRAQGVGDMRVAVNVPVVALETPGLVEHAAARLAAEGLPPSVLTIEVTEGAMCDQGTATASLIALRQLGIQVAVDDFGAGYSSMARLGSLPLDRLKLDRSLLAAAGRHREQEAFLRAMTAIGASLGLPVIAEGVETGHQLYLLRRVGCAHAQGYLFARPMPAAEVAGWLRAWPQAWLEEQERERVRRIPA